MKKYILRIVSCAVMLALAVFAAVFTAGHSLEELAWVTLDSEVVFFSARGEVCRLPHGLTVEGKSSGKYTAYYSSSLDGRFVAVIASHNTKTGGTLYRVDSSGAELLAEGVCRAVISDDGDRIAYIQKNDARSGSLYLYDHSRGSHQLLDTQAMLASAAHILALSPDGGSVAYRRSAGEAVVTTVWNRGEYHELGEDKFIIALADNMSSVYYFQPELHPDPGSAAYKYYVQNYYVRNGESDTLITTDRNTTYFAFNRDYTAVYVKPSIFIDADGGRHEVPYGFIDFAVPVTRQWIWSYDPGLNYKYERLDVERFRDMPAFVASGEGYMAGHINADYAFSPLIKNLPAMLDPYESSCEYQVSEDGSAALTLIEPAVLIGDAEDPHGDILVNGAVSFVAAPDFSYLYYIDENNDLYYYPMDGVGEPMLVAEGVAMMYLGKTGLSHSYRDVGEALVDDVLYFRTIYRNGRSVCLQAARGSRVETIFEPEGGFGIFELGDELILHHRYRRDEILHCDFYRLTPNGLTLLTQTVGINTYLLY